MRRRHLRKSRCRRCVANLTWKMIQRRTYCNPVVHTVQGHPYFSLDQTSSVFSVARLRAELVAHHAVVSMRLIHRTECYNEVPSPSECRVQQKSCARSHLSIRSLSLSLKEFYFVPVHSMKSLRARLPPSIRLSSVSILYEIRCAWCVRSRKWLSENNKALPSNSHLPQPKAAIGSAIFCIKAWAGLSQQAPSKYTRMCLITLSEVEEYDGK